MPILIKDYTWKQTDEKITVRVPIKGVLASKADIFTCDNFIKVHYTPFLFEVCLRDVINEDESICRVAKDEVIFELVKEEKGSWDVLEAPLSKAEILKTKQRAIDIAHQRSEAQQKKKAEKRQKISKLAIQEQIDLDTKQRNKIDSLRDHERNVAMREFEQWKQNKNTQEFNNKIKAIKEKIENNSDVSKESKPASQQNETQKTIKTQDKIKSTKKFSDKNIFDEPSKKLKDKNQQQDIPTPRNSGKIGVTFTPREFPTPSRESKAEEEKEWLAKQAEARRRTGFVIEDLRPEEHDPIWLKDKGDSFYKVGNYLGAISAYTLGIKLNPNLPALYSNRAAAQLALGNYRRVIQDTTKALELLTPCVEMNKSSRSLCCARRGTALCKIGMLQEGLGELEEAFRLCPDNKELEEDIKNVQTQLENSEDEESMATTWDEREEVDIT